MALLNKLTRTQHAIAHLGGWHHLNKSFLVNQFQTFGQRTPGCRATIPTQGVTVNDWVLDNWINWKYSVVQKIFYLANRGQVRGLQKCDTWGCHSSCQRVRTADALRWAQLIAELETSRLWSLVTAVWRWWMSADLADSEPHYSLIYPDHRNGARQESDSLVVEAVPRCGVTGH